MLAVAGLSEGDVKRRTRKLAEGDWGAFAPAERQGFAFAEKLARAPAAVSAGDVAELRDTFGAARSLDLIFYSSWVNYMTRVADGLQLPLERENVFMPAKK